MRTLKAVTSNGVALDLRHMYRTMKLISVVDARINDEVRSGRLLAATYPVRGLEGACAAIGSVARQEDRLVSTYRNLGDALAKGASVDGLLAEIFGRRSGVSKGKGGAMHLHDPAVNFVTSTGVVGSGLPIAVGIGLALQLAGDQSAVIVTFGDGATSIGAFHESMNLAALWKLPVLFVCQNNQWGEHTPIGGYAGSTDLTARAASYGMAAHRVDGFDPIATALAADDALQECRRGTGPVFLEIMTYRLTGHSGASDYSYVPKDELDAALRRDPVPTFRSRLVEDGALSEDELASIDNEVVGVVEAAIATAADGAVPSQDEQFSDVFATPLEGMYS